MRAIVVCGVRAADGGRWAIQDLGSYETGGSPGQPTIHLSALREVLVPKAGSAQWPSHREDMGPDDALDSYSGRVIASVPGALPNTGLCDHVLMPAM